MKVDLTPMRWPFAWKDPSALAILDNTAINGLLIDKGAEFAPVRSAAQQKGVQVCSPDALPDKVRIIKGEWPGVRMSRGGGGGGGGGAASGPTGVPWVDSNGWSIRLSAATHPDTAVWIDAAPRANTRLTAESYLIAIADSAAHGGRWVITLDDQLTTGIAAKRPEALDSWKKLTAAAGFFAARKEWANFVPEAVVGVVSDFAGGNEFMGHELLNLVTRAGQHNRVILKGGISAASFTGLRAVIYADAEAPSEALRKQILAYVQGGGMLITLPKWGAVAGAQPVAAEHPRYSMRSLGKGRVAVATEDQGDPWLLASDAVVLVSHRYDLVRLWNTGASSSHHTISPDRRRALVHLLFYANRGPDAAAVRVVGRYRTAKLFTVDQPEGRSVDVVSQKDAVEVHLPQVSQYVAVELGV